MRLEKAEGLWVRVSSQRFLNKLAIDFGVVDYDQMATIWREFRPVAQLAERRSPKPQVGGSIPSWPAARD